MSEAKLFGCKALRQLAIPRDSRPPCRDAIHWPGKNRLKERGKTTDAVRNLCAAWLAILMINPRLFSVIIHSSDGIQLVCMCVGGWLCNLIVFIFPSFGLVREKNHLIPFNTLKMMGKIQVRYDLVSAIPSDQTSVDDATSRTKRRSSFFKKDGLFRLSSKVSFNDRI